MSKVKIYRKTFAIMFAISIIIILIVTNVYLGQLQRQEGKFFLQETSELLPYVENFYNSCSEEDFDKAYAQTERKGIAFSIRADDSNLLWSGFQNLMFIDENKPSKLWIIGKNQGASSEDFETMYSYTQNYEDNGKIFVHELYSTEVYPVKGIFVVPKTVIITERIYQNASELSADSGISDNEKKTYKINLNLTKNYSTDSQMSGKIIEFEPYKYNTELEETIFLSSDDSRFIDAKERFASGEGIYSYTCEKTDLFSERLFMCVKEFQSIDENGNSVKLWAVFGKTVNLWGIYKIPIAVLGFLCFVIFMLSALVLAKSEYSSFLVRAEAEEKRRLITNSLAHDLKTPISAILAYADLLDEGINHEKQSYYLQRIRENSTRLNTIFRQTIQLSELNKSELKLNVENISLKELSLEILEQFETEPLFKNVSLTGNDFEIEADRALLSKALENFISNAFNNANEEGRIVISISAQKWSIFNTGSHIQDENLDKIWDAYFKEDVSRGKKSGSGLGLFIAKIILEAHGFGYSVHNEREGVRFSIFLSNIQDRE